MKKLTTITLTVLALVSLSLLATAKEDKVHPIKLLRARMQQGAGMSGIGTSKGTMTVWLQNLAEVPVDGVKMEIELYNERNRLVETIVREVGEMDAGKKEVLTIKWDVIAERIKRPRIWVYYNAGGPKLEKFEGDTPVW